MLQKVEWEMSSQDSEWYYIGEGGEYKSEFIQSNIDNFFSDKSIYLVTDRHSSKEIQTQNGADEIHKALTEFANATLCNRGLSRFISFNKIGVARQGKYDG